MISLIAVVWSYWIGVAIAIASTSLFVAPPSAAERPNDDHEGACRHVEVHPVHDLLLVVGLPDVAQRQLHHGHSPSPGAVNRSLSFRTVSSSMPIDAR